MPEAGPASPAGQSTAPTLIVRHFGVLGYHSAWRAMRALVASRDADSADEIWFLEHPPVFTLGQAGRREHLLDPGDIPVVASDRGGQVTFHGPGQLVAYVMLDLKRRRLGVKRLVHGLEQAIIDLLAASGLEGARRPGAPGVYVGGEKLAAIGLRIRNGFSYHGLAVNVDGDLAPFERIDPCGYPGLKAIRLEDLGVDWSVAETATRLLPHLAAQLRCPAESIEQIDRCAPAEICGVPRSRIDRDPAGARG